MMSAKVPQKPDIPKKMSTYTLLWLTQTWLKPMLLANEKPHCCNGFFQNKAKVWRQRKIKSTAEYMNYQAFIT